MQVKVLHVVRDCRCSGIVNFCRVLARTFSEFQHEILFLSGGNISLPYVNWLRDNHIRCTHNYLLNEEIVKDIEPNIICLHDAGGKRQFPIPLHYLNNYGVMSFHHSQTPVFPFVALDVYVSNYIRGLILPYEYCMKRWKTVNPGMLSEEYSWIVPRIKVKKPVIGNIQTTRALEKEGWTKIVETLSKVPDASFLLAGGESPKDLDLRFIHKPELLGMVPTYFGELDIFTVDCPAMKGWSHVCNEAMLAGKPVVAMDYGDGISEQIRIAGGFLAKTKEQFVEMLTVLVHNEQLRVSEGLKLRKWALDNCCDRTVRSALLDDFLQLI